MKARGPCLENLKETTLTSLLSTGLSIIYGMCMCMCAHRHVHPRCLDGSEGPQYQIFQLFLHVNTHPARRQGVYSVGD